MCRVCRYAEQVLAQKAQELVVSQLRVQHLESELAASVETERTRASIATESLKHALRDEARKTPDTTQHTSKQDTRHSHFQPSTSGALYAMTDSH